MLLIKKQKFLQSSSTPGSFRYYTKMKSVINAYHVHVNRQYPWCLCSNITRSVEYCEGVGGKFTMPQLL